MSEQTIPALILAGGKADEPIARHYGLPHKALVPVAGRTALAWVTEALLGASLVDPVAVATGIEAVALATAEGVPVVAPRGGTFLDTIRSGFEHFSEADRLLVCTCDLPLLTPEAVDDFTRQSLDSGAELCYSIVEGSRLVSLPGAAHRTLVRLREGRYTGGNLACVSRSFVQEHGHRVQAAFAGRKSQLKLARLLGPAFVLRLVTGRLDLPRIVRKAESLMGVSVAVIDSIHPSVCYDLDKPVHVELATRVLEDR